MAKESYEIKFEKDKKSKRIYAIAIDAIGYLSYVIPGVAEVSDIIWAPVAAGLVFILYKFRPKLALLGALGILVEEFVPFIDFIPTTLLLWLLIYVIDKEDTIEIYRQLEENDLEIVDDE
ncbi:hypothetical protein [Acidaminobacter sp. JC074]|uniref:hypothetical protein n=1 Tax=Acidaminobacter sp. JC074 TaxID=2530199 RepID=UPI001F0E53C4|nr:hypothetical protein [Acidaminobacter sp. JC074]